MNEVDYWDGPLKGLALPRGPMGGMNPSLYGFVGEPDTVPQRSNGNGRPWDIGEIIDNASQVICIIDPKRCRQQQDSGSTTAPEADTSTNTTTGTTGKKGIPEWVWFVGLALLLAIVLILILKK